MKTSNKILSISILTILLIISLLIIASRIIIIRNAGRPKDFSDSNTISKTFDLRGFNTIECSGAWQIEVIQGDNYRVSVVCPEELADDVNVHTWGDILTLDNIRKWRHRRSPFRAIITMPDLTGIRINEGASIFIDGFDTEDMEIKISGAAEIKADNSRIENLFLRCDGAADANLKESSVVNARLLVNGASRITLTMNGGTLKGSASGASSIVYYGTVSAQDIATNGAVSVRHR